MSKLKAKVKVKKISSHITVARSVVSKHNLHSIAPAKITSIKAAPLAKKISKLPKIKTIGKLKK